MVLRGKRKTSWTRHPRRLHGPERLESRLLLDSAPVVISEVMASNAHSLADQDGEYSDWIELHNVSEAAVNLAGWRLTDDAAQLNKWQFPVTSLAAGAYLVVFASGKDRHVAGQQLHTNFELAADGEYLALVEPDGATIASQFAPQYPKQRADVSYGVLGDQYWYFSPSSPGTANSGGWVDFVQDTKFSADRGFYSTAFALSISTSTPGAAIRYTTDGSTPTATTGTLYTAPITISHTTTLRAAAFKTGYGPSNVDAQTYLFVNDIITQAEMDRDVIGPGDLFSGVYAATIRDDLQSLPVMSLALTPSDFANLYGNPNADLEVPVSVEYFDSAGGGEFHSLSLIHI